MVENFFASHRDRLDQAVAAVRERDHWTPFPEVPSTKIYGEQAPAEGKAAFEALLNSDFPLDQPGIIDWVGQEHSPYGFPLGIRYPRSDVDTLLEAMSAALPQWRDAGIETRTGVCLEILQRLNDRSFELGHATTHTTGQAFVMAFQAGGPHAQDRGLEAVAQAYVEMTRHPRTARWTKPMRRGEPVRMDKVFTVVPRGLAVVVGCNTFPTWNGYPGLFASLVTGNPVVVKPHPRAVLPLAITVAVARQVLDEAGLDPNVVCLAAEEQGQGLASVLATRPQVRLVDFTGSTEYGGWLEANATQAMVHTEKSGVNTVVVDSTDDYAGMLRNLAFSLSLYSGQMCTTPQNLLVPRTGIRTDQGHRGFDEFGADLAAAVRALLDKPAAAADVLGAIVNDGVLERLVQARELGDVVLDSVPFAHPEHPEARARTPLLIKLDAASQDYLREWFGPITFLVATDNTKHSLEILQRTTTERGALTAAVYASDEAVLEAAERAALDAGVHLSCNLTGGVFVNQAAAFSDFHGTGANPAATAALTDPAFIAGRFHLVQSRRPTPAGATP